MSHNIVKTSCTHSLDAPTVHARLDALTSALHKAQCEIDVLRRRRARPSAWSLAMLAVSAGTLGLGVSANSQALQSMNLQTPFHIYGDNRSFVMRVTDNNGSSLVEVGPANSGGVVLGSDASGNGFLAIKAAGGGYAVVADTNGVRLMGADGKTTAANLGLDSEKRPLLRLGDDKTGGVDAGTGASGGGFVILRTGKGQPGITMGQREGRPLAVAVHDASGASTVAQLGADASGAGQLLVRGADGKSVATLGQAPGAELGLTVGASDTAARASLTVDGQGRGQIRLRSEGGDGFSGGVGDSGMGFAVVHGASGEDAIALGAYRGSTNGVRLLDTAGGERVTIAATDKGTYAVNVAGSGKSPVASFGEASIGGGAVTVYNPSGTIGAIMSGTGQIHVAGPGGQTLATMVAEKDQGAFSVRSASGTTIARMGEGTGGGLFQLADQAGNAKVEAGIHTSGVGLVRVYPLGSPSAGMIGMPATFLIGRAGGK